MVDISIRWVIFGIYCVAMLAIGWAGYKATKNATDYFIAGRRIGLFVALPLYVAGFISAASMVGFTDFVYKNGYMFIIPFPLGLAGGCLVLAYMAPRISAIRKTLFSSPDLYAARFYSNTVMRSWISFLVLANMFFYVVMGLIGGGAVLAPFLNIDYFWAVLLVGVVFLTYTTLGGMFSVAWTNVAQYGTLIVAIIIMAAFELFHAGGLTGVNQKIMEIAPQMMGVTSSKIGWIWVIGTAISLVMGVPITTYYHRMFFSCRSERVSSAMIGFGGFGILICYVGILLMGLGGRALFPNLSHGESLLGSIMAMMNPVLGGIVVAGIIAALQSSVDNQLLSASSIITRDFYTRLMGRGEESSSLMRVAVWSTFLIGLGCILVALWRPATIIQIYVYMANFTASTLFPALALGIFWPRCTREAGIIGSIVAFPVVLLWYIFGPKEIPPVLVAAPLSIILMVIISYLTPPPPKEVDDLFFENWRKRRR